MKILSYFNTLMKSFCLFVIYEKRHFDMDSYIDINAKSSKYFKKIKNKR